MYRLPQIALFFVFVFQLQAQSPHGPDFKINCSDCHTSADWKTMRSTFDFNHDTTLFALDGRHATVDCRQCHTSLVFTESSPECVSCHTDIHQQTVGQDCARCHTTNNWLVDNISEIHLENGFPLLGAHVGQNCIDCHVSETDLQFDRIGNDCINCHLDDYSATQNPNHQTNGFSTNCGDCHDINKINWGTNEAYHNFFPLTNGHAISDCIRCHTNGTFANAPTACIACHQMDYQNAKSPDHVASGFSTDCNLCHTTDIGWRPANFPSHDVFWPLTGAHEKTDCAACHNSTFTNTPTTCFGCHAADYNGTSDPDHSAAGFPTDCETCHSTNAWAPTSWNHDTQYFPIYSGNHKGEWNDCSDCHTTPGNYKSFSCIDCHEHDNKGDLDDEHKGISGYAYNSQNCYACHPDGKE